MELLYLGNYTQETHFFQGHSLETSAPLMAAHSASRKFAAGEGQFQQTQHHKTQQPKKYLVLSKPQNHNSAGWQQTSALELADNTCFAVSMRNCCQGSQFPPTSGDKNASFGSDPLCFHGHLYSTTTFGHFSSQEHLRILSRLAPIKGFCCDIEKPWEINWSLWCFLHSTL